MKTILLMDKGYNLPTPQSVTARKQSCFCLVRRAVGSPQVCPCMLYRVDLQSEGSSSRPLWEVGMGPLQRLLIWLQEVKSKNPSDILAVTC